MNLKNNFIILKHMIKKVLCNPRQTLHYLHPYKVRRFFYYLRHDGLKGVSRILDDRLLMGSDLKMDFKINPLIKGNRIEDFPLIVFEEQINPEVSIIIPVYNQFVYTYNCLRSIYINSSDTPFEVILADDGSTDLTTSIDFVVKGIRIVKAEKNIGFIRNCNFASQEAKGKYIVLLNNDTQVEKNWLESMVRLMVNVPEAGLIGSKLIYPDGSLQECGGILWKDGSAWNFGHGKNPALPEFSYVKESDYVSGASIMIRKKLWDQLGGFDETYIPAYCEDSDLAIRVRKAGYKVLVQPESIVVHFEGKSNGKNINKGVKSYQITNEKKLFERWGTVLQKENLDNGQDVFLARDRSQLKKKILVIDHKVPMYDNDAGARTVYMYVKLFLELGFKVTFLPDNFFPNQPYTKDLEEMGVEVLYGNYYFSYHDQWLRDNVKYYDYFMLNRPHISIKYIDIINSNRAKNSRLIYYGHDLHFLRERRMYDISGKEEDLCSSEKWKKIESYLINNADISWTVSNVEKEILEKDFPQKVFHTIPIYIYDTIDHEGEFDIEHRKNLLFVGGFNHPPNVDAVLWFAREIFPQIKLVIPEIEWNIVGINPTDEISALDGGSIHVLGFVSDERLQHLYNETRLVVVPLRYGAGVKGKVVEAIYNQVPVITTPIGAEGISERENAFFVSQPNSCKFAKDVVALYKDKVKLKIMSQNTSRLINTYYTETQAREVVQRDFI